MPEAIALRAVGKSFGTVAAVDDLTLSVPQGSIFGFIGPNGSGKTTTIRMLLHILLPDRGEISVLGSRDTRAARDRVGYLPEERGLYRKMEVRRQLLYYGQLKGRTRTFLAPEIAGWLSRFELSAWAEKKIEALSKGMQQKVQFIAAVVARPDLAILDEPFSGLDPVNAEAMVDAVQELRRRGTTVVLSTHDMSVAERLCDRICMIHRGRKVLDGTLEEIQAEHGRDAVRVRADGGDDVLRAVPGVLSVSDRGRLSEVRLSGDPQEFLRALAARARVHHFEVARPSLHDIFVRIARPSSEQPPDA